MKLLAVLAMTAAALSAADAIDIFGRQWSVPYLSDWKIEREGGAETLLLLQGRQPLPGPRRPFQFALTEAPPYEELTVEADVRPTRRSLIIVFGYQDAAHFNYAHFSTDTAAQAAVHNGVFHVYGGERVRISHERGPASFPAINRWYRVRLVHNARTGSVQATVDGRPVPALNAVDVSLGSGKVGIGSFDETADFRNVKIATRP